MISYLEMDLLECEVKWALESITMNKASGSDGIPAELFQVLKSDAQGAHVISPGGPRDSRGGPRDCSWGPT